MRKCPVCPPEHGQSIARCQAPTRGPWYRGRSPFVRETGRIGILWYGARAMALLADVERFLERVFERSTARLFRAHVQPVQVVRRVERSMERARTKDGVARSSRRDTASA